MGEAARVALRYFQALSDGDVDGAVELVADGGDFRSPVGKLPDKAAIRAFLGGFDTAFPDAHFDVEHVFEDDALVAIEGVYRATHSGPLVTPDGQSLPATGRRVRAPFATVFEVADGRIRSHRPYWDLAGFMAQLTG